jgi:hypothetical protein
MSRPVPSIAEVVLKRLATVTLAVLVAGLGVAACSSTPAAQPGTTTSTRATASAATTAPLPPTTSTTTVGNAACFRVFASIGAITSGAIKAKAALVANNCSPADLHDVANARVEFTAHGRPLNAVGQALVAEAVSIAEQAACPTNPHSELCP